MCRIFCALFVLLLGSAFAAPGAQAVPMSHFSYVGGGHTLTFDLPTQPVPYGSDPVSSAIAVATYILDNVVQLAVGPSLGVYTVPGPTPGGFATGGLPIVVIFYGAQLFSLPTSAPTFLDGVYVGTDNTNFNNQGGLGTLAITSDIPEPTSLTLFGLGLAALAATRRQVRR